MNHQEKVNTQIENLAKKIQERNTIIQKNKEKIDKLTKINQKLESKNEKARKTASALSLHLEIQNLKEREAQSHEDFDLEL